MDIYRNRNFYLHIFGLVIYSQTVPNEVSKLPKVPTRIPLMPDTWCHPSAIPTAGNYCMNSRNPLYFSYETASLHSPAPLFTPSAIPGKTVAALRTLTTKPPSQDF